MDDAPSLLELSSLRYFVTESNRIEGILRRPYKRELAAHAELLALPTLSVAALCQFVSTVAPGKELRVREGLDVRVGSHIAPRGGPRVGYELFDLLADANERDDPYSIHCRYETLHPFMDGNGRSGRAVWLWQMLRQQRATWALRTGFLHLFYYQTLEHLPRVTAPSDSQDSSS